MLKNIFFPIIKGLLLTLSHIKKATTTRKIRAISDDKYFEQKDGIVTVQYPHQKVTVPIVGRYQLDVAINDCVVCDLCAKICPVKCIDIQAIKAVGDIGKTSDGTTKRLHAANFVIDHAKCMFCGLCTTVCPTECIIMTDNYDVSVRSVDKLNTKFSVMTEKEILEKQHLLERYNLERIAAKQNAQQNND